MGRTGVWLIGAQGSLASTVVTGARAIARGLAGRGALVTELPELRGLPFVDFEDLVFGGWDVAPTGLRARARAMEIEDRALPPGLVAALDDDLAVAEGRVRPGFSRAEARPRARSRRRRSSSDASPWRPRSSGSATTSTRFGARTVSRPSSS